MTGRGHNREESTVIIVNRARSGWQVGAYNRPDSVGKQWVVSSAGRKRPFSKAEHNHSVEFNPDSQSGRTDKHPVAEGPVAA